MTTKKNSQQPLLRIGQCCLGLALYLLLLLPEARAQYLIEGDLMTLHYVDAKAQFFKIPDNTTADYLYLRAEGADGGKRFNDDLNINYAAGGEGATINAHFRIGDGDDQVPAGSDIAVVIGHEGASRRSVHMDGAGGGGGTGVLFRRPGAREWTLLLVAGGGGGAAAAGEDKQEHGDAANVETYGSLNGGSEGKGGGEGTGDEGGSGGGGGGIFTSGGGGEYGGSAGWTKDNTVSPAGGSGGKHFYNDTPFYASSGGWGFGGGGSGCSSGGGGGGYSGGGGGHYSHDDSFTNRGHGGGGGGSYVNETYAVSGSVLKIKNGHTYSPGSGFVQYQLTNPRSVRLAKNTSKCINVRGITSGDNVQLGTCNNLTAQNWFFNGLAVKNGEDLGKCLDLTDGQTANGTNIQLVTCHDSDAQKWIYDVGTQTIRSTIDIKKCVDVDHGIVNNFKDGTNIQLFRCNDSAPQQWLIEDIPSTLPDKAYIRLTRFPDRCLDVYHGTVDGFNNYSNIQLWKCNGTGSQLFAFEDGRIKVQAVSDEPGICMDVDPNGSNVRLWECKDQDNQRWIYDGMSKNFRSVADPKKCLDVDHSNFNEGTNIQVWECNGTDAQRFEMY